MYSNGVIYGATSISDIQRVLGVSINDLGTLCRHKNINKWARYKPVIYPNIFALRSRVINTWHFPITPDPNFDATTGLNIGMLASFENPIDIADYDSYQEVNYSKPYGGNNAPYRLTDWCEYDHNAKPPAVIQWGNKFAIDKSLTCMCTFQTGNSDHGSILFSDIMNELVTLHGYNAFKTYLCMAVIDTQGMPFWFFFSEEPYGSGKSEWYVQTRNKYDFQTAITNMVGQMFYFVAFLVNDTNDNIDSDIIYNYGISASDMNEIKNQFKVCALSFDESGGMYHDRTSIECKKSSASPSEDVEYRLETAFLADSEGYFTYNYHDVLVIKAADGTQHGSQHDEIDPMVVFEVDAFLLATLAKHKERGYRQQHAYPLPHIQTFAKEKKGAHKHHHGSGGIDGTDDGQGQVLHAEIAEHPTAEHDERLEKNVLVNIPSSFGHMKDRAIECR